MRHEIIMSGFGGQGVLVMGQILTYAGMLEDKNVSWIPSYGMEMRGGTANCSIIVTNRPTGSPMVEKPTAAVVLNLPSLDKFESMVRPGGVLIINSSLVDKAVQRQDIEVYRVPVNEIATELGNPKMTNMVALGALIAATKAVAIEALFKAFAKKFAAKPHVITANQEAIKKGYDCVKNA
ncbi:2-oxoacid:acceptor oxidoreductase family protein [Sporomusa sp.]|uniref:2-oxoacid:acceptor oxidoreductase family protein n=1 Tax=Sporomusa sp. TaxID=2078658 RepID=UPI002CCE7828|nr:2-oxoacid:acceptor oxidoreductase family protein [Sporomusa sp.]HWR06147.1 2-oxoacid:acceptor oxidoreductase family protein [Sporomusa sp.]